MIDCTLHVICVYIFIFVLVYVLLYVCVGILKINFCFFVVILFHWNFSIPNYDRGAPIFFLSADAGTSQ